MGKRIVSAFLWVMMTAAVLALILGICYGIWPLVHNCIHKLCCLSLHVLSMLTRTTVVLAV